MIAPDKNRVYAKTQSGGGVAKPNGRMSQHEKCRAYTMSLTSR
jgi:hypothetical protein